MSHFLDDLRATIRRMAWSQYETDPSWSGFCEFGPEDIGGVWEKLGVIHKKPQISAVHMSSDTAGKIRASGLKGSGCPVATPLTSLHGVPVFLNDALGDEIVLQYEKESSSGYCGKNFGPRGNAGVFQEFPGRTMAGGIPVRGSTLYPSGASTVPVFPYKVGHTRHISVLPEEG